MECKTKWWFESPYKEETTTIYLNEDGLWDRDKESKRLQDEMKQTEWQHNYLGRWKGDFMNFDYSKISPGIRDLVRELREIHGMNTTDSGDGTNLAAGMEGALQERHVFMVTDIEEMINRTTYLQRQYKNAYLECSWSPGESAIIMIYPDGRPEWV